MKLKKLSEKEELSVKELIERRRKQLLVHSIIYYKLDDSLIPDSKWAEWAIELEELTKKYPEIAEKAWLNEEFQEFDHSTGYNLPLETPWAVAKALWLVQMAHTKYFVGDKFLEYIE